MLYSKTLARALGQALVDTAKQFAVIKIHDGMTLRDETYEEFGQYFWAQRKGQAFKISTPAFIDFWNHSGVVVDYFNALKKKHPGQSDMFIAQLIFNDMLKNFSASETDTKNFLNGERESKSTSENIPSSVHKFTYPFLILLGAYKYLPNTVKNSRLYCSTLTSMTSTINIKPKGPMNINGLFKTYMDANLEILTFTIQSCPKDLKELDKQFLRQEMIVASLQAYEASSCVQCVLSLFSQKPETNGVTQHASNTKLSKKK
ncbi:MAG: hypothetical protein ABSF18_01385 [Gammaproteobacteria bacterium]|jgi:hypothetical protein